MKAGRQAVSSYIDSISKKSPSYRVIRVPMSKIYLGVFDVIVIWALGLKDIYVTTLELSSLALLMAIGGILFYAGRNYYISLDEEPRRVV
ncbi:hypothetical protein [Methanocella conradii]|uniref:hypothetical protein n=1 Tax=Methanocella conradii TaxID=1175444 RepID=UPI0024B39D5A|nr:hypothetical protein [Methanocella conradii]MDI6897207.1 hypothetical protein [Methanocella conradii]